MLCPTAPLARADGRCIAPHAGINGFNRPPSLLNRQKLPNSPRRPNKLCPPHRHLLLPRHPLPLLSLLHRQQHPLRQK